MKDRLFDSTDSAKSMARATAFGFRDLPYGVVVIIFASCGESRKPTSVNMEARGTSGA
jgi:hypothetical protein